jgi:hypothetical protein
MDPLPKVPWHEYGEMVREITICRPFLVELGLAMPNSSLRSRYFSWLHRKGLIRLKTTTELMMQEPTLA